MILLGEIDRIVCEVRITEIVDVRVIDDCAMNGVVLIG